MRASGGAALTVCCACCRDAQGGAFDVRCRYTAAWPKLSAEWRTLVPLRRAPRRPGSRLFATQVWNHQHWTLFFTAAKLTTGNISCIFKPRHFSFHFVCQVESHKQGKSSEDVVTSRMNGQEEAGRNSEVFHRPSQEHGTAWPRNPRLPPPSVRRSVIAASTTQTKKKKNRFNKYLN